MSKPNIAILLEFGFHEIKKYVHSGFAAKLGEEFNVIWFAIDKGSKDFHDNFSATGFPIVYFNASDFSQSSSKTEQYNQIVRRCWMANSSVGAFHNSSKVRVKSLKTKIIGNSIFKGIFERLALREISKLYVNEKLVVEFKAREIEHVILSSNSSFSKAAYASAKKIGIAPHLLVNSWKDIFTDNFIPYADLSTIFIWSDKMKEDYLHQAPYLRHSKFVITGNPTFDVLKDLNPKFDRRFYAEKYNLAEEANWLLYTMMPVGLTKDEIETIQLTANALLTTYSKEEYAILVRKNPTHTKEEFTELSLPENLKIAEHFCTFDAEKDMIVQSPEGEREWLDLLYHCSMNLSVPSTVTLEFLALNKVVLNIAYNNVNQLDLRIQQFFEAGFYRPLFKSKQAIRIESKEELVSLLPPIKTDQNFSTQTNEILASEIIIASLKDQD